MTFYPPGTSETGGTLAVSTVFGIIATITCFGRARTVKQRGGGFQIQEWYLAIALVLTLISLGIQWTCVVRGGTGRHVTDIEPLDAVLTLKLIIPFEVLYGVTIMLIKWSVLIFYQRLFGVKDSYLWCLRATILVVFLWMVSVVLETFLLCRPLAFNWDTSIDGICGDRIAVYVIAGATNMVTDFMVIMLPIPMIWRLQISTAKRVGLMFTFSLGLFITAISIIRLKSLMDISFTDPTWTLPMGLLWSVLEPELAIIVANFPFLRPYIPKCLQQSKLASLFTPKYAQQDSANLPRHSHGHGVPLQTIGGGWANFSADTKPALQRSDTVASTGTGSQTGLVDDGNIKAQTKWSVTHQ